MSCKLNNSFSSKSSSCRFTTSRTSSCKSCKTKVSNPKRVLPSKKVTQKPSSDRKALSTGILSENKKPEKPKKNTKSDFGDRKSVEVFDYCKDCGDVKYSKKTTGNSVTSTKISGNSVSSTKLTKTSRADNKINHSSNATYKYTKRTNNGKLNKLSHPVQQYYRNENYEPSSGSVEDITNGAKKISLDTIKEVSEIHPSESIFKMYPESEDEIAFLDPDDHDSLAQLKEFRQKNYFECHSAKSRVRNKGSATSLQDHRCVYRFYLNDRLFPVPLSTDHNNQVRCMECHLPMELNVEEATKINGTIQAKVTIGKKNQDLMLLLPVKEPLIITEKRKEEKQNKEVVFFGVINLDGFGNSIFSSTMPSNSFALKYQKGFKEFENKEEYSYRDFDKSDVIVI